MDFMGGLEWRRQDQKDQVGRGREDGLREGMWGKLAKTEGHLRGGMKT